MDTDFGNVTRFSIAQNLTETKAEWLGAPKIYMDGSTLVLEANLTEAGFLYAMIDQGTAEIDLYKRREIQKMRDDTPKERTQSLEIDQEREHDLEQTRRRRLQYISMNDLIQPLDIANGDKSKRVKLERFSRADGDKNGTFNGSIDAYKGRIEFFKLKEHYVYRYWLIGTSNNPAIQYADLTQIESGFIKIVDPDGNGGSMWKIGLKEQGWVLLGVMVMLTAWR